MSLRPTVRSLRGGPRSVAWVSIALLPLVALLTGPPAALGTTGPAVTARPPAVPASGQHVPSRPLVVEGNTWYLAGGLTSGPAAQTFTFGARYGYPVSGDWDGDGTPTVGSVLNATWSLRNSNSSGPADLSFNYGVPGDLPVVGDWDGNGTDTPGVVRGDTWYLRNSNTGGPADVVLTYGQPGDVPVVGDWDGNGTDTPGVRRGGTWYLRDAPGSGPATRVVAFGWASDRPVTGDWNGDGVTTLGVVRGATWFLTDGFDSIGEHHFPYGWSCALALSTGSGLARPAGAGTYPTGRTGQDVTRLTTSRKVVALTFDAGANADAVPSILRTLTRTCTPATFFFTGAFTRAFPEQSRQVALRFPVGNHTDTHPDLTTLSDAAVRAQVSAGAAAVRAVTRFDTHPLFRFPFGARDARTIALVNSLGYVGVRWTVDTLGWEGTSGGQSAASVVQRVLAAATPGEIVLMHVGSNPDDGTTLDADALPQVISGLQARGYTFVSLPGQL